MRVQLIVNSIAVNTLKTLDSAEGEGDMYSNDVMLQSDFDLLLQL